jgi:ABC-2 type transport system permease protein
MPLTFLSGVFYSVDSLPQFWQVVSHLNPFFYVVDGFRYGFLGVSDVSPVLSFSIVSVAASFAAAIALRLLSSGYKLRL